MRGSRVRSWRWGRMARSCKGFFPIHQFVEKCKSIYITTGAQTLKNNTRTHRMKGCALYSVELVQMGWCSIHLSSRLGHTRGWVLQNHDMSQADSAGSGSWRPVARIAAFGSHAEQLHGYGSRKSVCNQESVY